MIESVTIKKIATFDSEGIQINDLKKVNFIYGVNASGKTTISNFLQNPNNEVYVNNACSAKWKNSQQLRTLVYNRDFREKNFGNGKMAGVFTLGEATTEQIKEIEDKQQQLNSVRAEGLQKKATIEKQEEERKALESKFSESCWTKIRKKHEDIFNEAFKGSVGSKDNFKNRLLQEYIDNTAISFDYNELVEKAKTIFGEQPQNITPITPVVFDRVIEIGSNPVWNKPIVGQVDVDIAKLINKLNLTDWVSQGRGYLQENNICPFCQQPTINDDFRKQIESFFDETYTNDLRALKELKNEYNSLSQNIINELNTIESNQKGFKGTKLDVDKFSAYLKTLTNQFTVNRERLNSKEKEPSRRFELINVQEQFNLIAALLENANQGIQKHNSIVANFQREKSTLTKSIWKYLVEEFKTDIIDFNEKKNGLEKGIENLNKHKDSLLARYKVLDAEIKGLSKNVTGIQSTIDEINRLLKSFGFLNFKVVPVAEKGFYQIQREDGTIAEKTLSEGEITFITFLYFLQIAKGGITEDTVNEERILVIDDPVSSLDSNVLFIVSSLIKEIIKKIKSGKGNIKQLILLTHNIYFHKEVSFIDARTKKCSDTHYWILRKNDKTSTIQAFGADNPISSSYELLWQELKNDSIRSCITIQNIMRRIIEYYFKLLGKYGDDELIQKFSTKEEQEICRSLICWINDGSHSVFDDLCVELQDSTVTKFKKVFRDIFVYNNNQGHYDMMMQENNEI